MKSRGVHLQYSFQAEDQRGAAVQNPLFDLLSAVRDHGSIQRAATALGASYRHVWGSLKTWQDVMGEPLVSWTQGHPARLTPFAERLLWAETHARARLAPHIEALRAELEHVLAAALDGSQQVLTVYASHDLALPLLRDTARQAERLHIDLRFAGSIDALRALAEGRCAVAGFHVPPLTEGAALFARHLKPLLKPGRHKLIGCTRRAQGLVVAPGNPLALNTLADLTRTRARFAQRQEGSATRLLTEHLLAQEQLDALQLISTRTEDSHTAVAAAVAGGLADAGIAIEAAAAEHGLAFVPLAQEDYFLVCLDDVLDQPPVLALRRALRDPAWQAALAALPGYAAQQPGDVLSLTRALPWWNFRKPKAR
ncbi:MAG: helix-turn-helix transcriptional regulator [Rubrivivax sp.]|nr:helix-turn-helix transcriptional regulator [Rubrivivax sp.]